ncbi:MAG: hypothetical protein HDT29_06880 [Clostridiales bacterium]|nr:hypothetical protein [Clostridiales bacterium]
MYKTRLPLVEPTKLLERITVDNLCFINPLGHDYIKERQKKKYGEEILKLSQELLDEN